jgi:hypothetical protein
MGDATEDPDALLRRHECLKRLLGAPEQIAIQKSKMEEQDPVAAEYDLTAKQALQLLDHAYLTGNETIIGTAISLWNMAIDRRRHRSK